MERKASEIESKRNLIRGSEKLVLAIIGNPVSQVKSPGVFNNYFQSQGLNAEMVPFHVEAEDFEAVMNGLRKIRNFVGAIITLPHKSKSFEIATIKSMNAMVTGAANVLVPARADEWACDMLDGIGLVNALQKRNIKIEGLKTLIIGAGGAGSAIAVALHNIGKVSGIGIADIDLKKAEQLAAKLPDAEAVLADPESYQLVVNASPVGMGTQELPVNPEKLVLGTIVCDAIMHPHTTALLEEAEKRGCTIVRGMEMLEGQVDPILKTLNFRTE